MLAGRQVGIFFQVFRSKRTGNCVFLGEPFTQVNQLATVRAEWPILPGEPIARLPAGRTFHLNGPAHGRVISGLSPHFSADGFQIIGKADCGRPFYAANLHDGLDISDDGIKLGGGQRLAVENRFNVLS